MTRHTYRQSYLALLFGPSIDDDHDTAGGTTTKGKKGRMLAFPRLQSIGLVQMTGCVRGIRDGVGYGSG